MSLNFPFELNQFADKCWKNENLIGGFLLRVFTANVISKLFYLQYL